MITFAYATEAAYKLCYGFYDGSLRYMLKHLLATLLRSCTPILLHKIKTSTFLFLKLDNYYE